MVAVRLRNRLAYGRGSVTPEFTWIDFWAELEPSQIELGFVNASAIAVGFKPRAGAAAVAHVAQSGKRATWPTSISRIRRSAMETESHNAAVRAGRSASNSDHKANSGRGELIRGRSIINVRFASARAGVQVSWNSSPGVIRIIGREIS